MSGLSLWWKQAACNHQYTNYLFSADYSKSDIEKEVLICCKCDKEKPIRWLGFFSILKKK